MELGLNYGIPAEEYHAHPATSNSDLKWIAPPYTEAHFHAYKLGQIERKETEAMRIGTLTHMCLLEPERMATLFAVKPDGMTFASKDGKEWKAENEGKFIVSGKTADMLAGMSRSVLANKTAQRIIAPSDKEVSILVEDRGIKLKCRTDILPKTGNLIADLKTIELCDLDSVEKSIFTYGYHRQAAFYRRVVKLAGLDRPKFVLIFVEKTPPYCCAVYEVDETAIEIGEAEIRRDLSLLRQCVESGVWPGREDGINSASLPTWALERIGNII